MRFIFVALLAAAIAFVGCDSRQALEPSPTDLSADALSKAGKGDVPRQLHLFCPSTGVATIPLWAGTGNQAASRYVGDVLIKYNENGTIDVTFAFNGEMFPWVATAIHFDIGSSLGDIPVNSAKNPVPGQFDYVLEVNGPLPTPTFNDIPLPPGGGPYYVAAHASVVRYGGINGFAFYLPNDPVTVMLTPGPNADSQSYWKIELSNAGFMSGTYKGWCIDADLGIDYSIPHQAMLYSSYETLPAGIVEHPENFDLLNYIVNTYAVGQTVTLKNPDCSDKLDPATQQPMTGVLTYGDIQYAIWMLIDNNLAPGLGAYDPARAQAIMCDARNHENFVPGCNQSIVFIIVPSTGEVQIVIGQPTVAQVPVPCQDDAQTAWGDGFNGKMFPGAKQWATYFLYNTVCP